MFARLSPSALLFVLLLVLLQWLVPYEVLALDSEWIQQGAYWRLVSGHFIHFNWVHLGLNLMGVFLVLYVGPSWLLSWRLWPILLWLALGTGLLLHGIGEQQYIGFSGLLYGLLVLALWFSPYYPPWVCRLAAALVALKVITEQVPGWAGTGTAELIGAGVLTQAHLFGLLMALPIGLPLWWHQRRQAKVGKESSGRSG